MNLISSYTVPWSRSQLIFAFGPWMVWGLFQWKGPHCLHQISVCIIFIKSWQPHKGANQRFNCVWSKVSRASSMLLGTITLWKRCRGNKTSWGSKKHGNKSQLSLKRQIYVIDFKETKTHLKFLNKSTSQWPFREEWLTYVLICLHFTAFPMPPSWNWDRTGGHRSLAWSEAIFFCHHQ